jgi:hypothetical protein
MWMTDPKLMCRQHLLGEHVELHMLAGAIAKGTNLNGFVANNCLQFSDINNRHDELVAEMKARNYNHKSLLSKITNNNYSDYILNSRVDIEQSLKDLMQRCKKCSQRLGEKQNGR